MAPGAPRTPSPGLRALAPAFPVLLLAFGGFFLLGRIGFWSDDYWHNLRDPVSGALPPLTFRGLTMDRGFFLRPLFYSIVPALTTLSWTLQWPAHLALVLSHGLATFLLWSLLRTLGTPRRIAGAAALLFMVYPVHFEALFWVSSLPTTLATSLMLALMIAFARFARLGKAAPFRGWWLAALMPAAVFAVCCLNEQPAMGVLALPLVSWAALSAAPLPEPGAARRRHILRAIIPAFLCGLAVVLYVFLVMSDPAKPPGARGSAEQFVTLEGLPARLAEFLDAMWRRLVMKDFAAGALSLGWSTLRSSGALALAWLLPLALAAAAWHRMGRTPASPTEFAAPVLPLLLLGLVIFVTGWAPIAMLAVYDPDSRTWYWPAIGMTLMFSAIASGIGREARASGLVRGVLSAALLAWLLACAIMLVGVQGAFRTRWNLDRQQGREMRELLPDPAPLTFFIPLEIDGTGVRTGSSAFDGHFRSVWEFPWATPKFIKSVYQRDDVRCGHWRHWTPGRPVAGANPEGIHYTDRLGPRFPEIEGSGSRIPWDRAVPFVIDRDGHVHLVTTVVAGGARIRTPQTRDAVDRGAIAERAAELPSR